MTLQLYCINCNTIPVESSDTQAAFGAFSFWEGSLPFGLGRDFDFMICSAFPYGFVIFIKIA